MAESVADVIAATLRERELEWEQTDDASFVVTLPGTHKLKTVVNLVVGDHALRVEAFVMLDYAVVQSLVLLYGVVFVVLNLLVDISYGLLDPRVRT